MATCKEYTDVLGSDNASMSMLVMSDDCNFDDGNGSETDSDADSDTAPRGGIDVVFQYKKKIRKKEQDIKKHLHIPLSLDWYLKWQYVMKNNTLLQHRIVELQKLADKVAVDDGILEVSLGRQKEDPDFDSLASTIVKTLMSDTDSIAISLYAMRESLPSSEYYQVLVGVIQQSGIGQRFEVYTEMSEAANSKVIRVVYDVKHADKVAQLFNKATKDTEKKVRSGWVSMVINLPIVYYQVFNKYEMKKLAGQVSQAVFVFLNITESKDEFNVELRGPQNEIHKVRKWMDDDFLHPYHCQVIDFGGIHLGEESVDIPCVVADTLENTTYQDLFWRIGHHSSKIWVCSTNGSDVQDAVKAVKMCVKQTTRPTKTVLHTEDLEDMMNELVADNGPVVGRSISVRLSGEAVYLTGAASQLGYINRWVHSYVLSTEMEPTCTIEVDGLSPHIDEEGLEMYFENFKRSGGGEIIKLDIRKDVAYIEYDSEEVAQRVVDHGEHRVNGELLTVKIFDKTQKPCLKQNAVWSHSNMRK